MTGLFLLDLVLALLFLFLPGILFSRALRIPAIQSIATAPFLSALGYYLVAFCYVKAGFAVAWWAIVLPVGLFGLLLFAVSKVLVSLNGANKGGHQLNSQKRKATKTDWLYLGGYLCFASIVGVFVFLIPSGGVASFSFQYDNYAHLTLVRDFLESGFFAQSSLLGYPSAWHCLAALIASIGQYEISVAVNALNFVICCVIFPAGMFAFLKELFGDKKLALISGAICTVAFTEFPWGLLAFGPLYPNLFGFAVLPAIMTVFISAFKATNAKARLSSALVFLLGCVALVQLHPNVIFSGIVILSPFVVFWIWNYKSPKTQNRIKLWQRLIFMLGFIAVVFAVWLFCYKSPMFASVVNFNWPAKLTYGQGIIDLLLLKFTVYSAPQYVLGVLVIVGVIYSVVKKKQRWLVLSYAIALLILFVSVTTEGRTKHFLSGFWYTDPFRLACTAVLVAIPLASLGLTCIANALNSLLERLTHKKSKNMLVQLAVVAIAAITIFSPNPFSQDVASESAFERTERYIGIFSSSSEKAAYDEEEVSFVSEVKEIVGDSKVINLPYDGSFLSYAINDLDVAYRQLESEDYWKEGVDPEGKLLRAELNEYAENSNVREAVKSSGAQYVMLLDVDDTEGKRMYPGTVDREPFKGITAITDNTPGFKVVLARGDMRLYRITD